MKKILLASLLATSLTFASEYDYEATLLGGYVINENNLNLTNQLTGGAEFQFNNLDSIISPEISVFYARGQYTRGEDIQTKKYTDIYRVALNGVYQYEELGFLIPFSKVGIGYEAMEHHRNSNADSPFLDAGLGAKVPFADNFALKLEAIYMAKYNDDRWDNNLALLAGLTYRFGTSTQDAARESERERIERQNAQREAREEAERKEKERLEKLAQEEERKKAEAEAAAAALLLANGDDDEDGVKNKDDKCPNTTDKTLQVDEKGCYINPDIDGDGVKNELDECPNTSKNVTKVDAKGCVVAVNLMITFRNGSTNVDAASQKSIKEFSTFLKQAPNYTVTIVGYTDSVGSAKNNLRLSQLRADKVKNMIVAEGIDPKRVASVGKGEDNPIASNMLKEGRAKNRRIEAVLHKN